MRWGVWVWIEAVAFSILAVARSTDAGMAGYLEHRKSREDRRALRLVPRHHQSWWHLAKQPDDSFISQISLDVEAANLTDRPVRIIKARLIRPRMKGELVHGEVMLPKAGSPSHSHKQAVPPHEAIMASLHIMVRGSMAPQGRPVRATIGITDQFGDEHRLKGIVLKSNDPKAPKQPWINHLVSFLRSLPGVRGAIRAEPDEILQPPSEWQHHGKFEQADLILTEERRCYAARGRIEGGLGSLNVGLQSEPNYGWTTVGTVPTLLWDKAQAKPVESPNIARLMKLYVKLDTDAKKELEQYLLSHLHKRSPYADVSYFTFLGLHRMGRTVDALRAARSKLAGDKVYGYSNLLGTLSAVVSHEHFEIDPGIYSGILEVIAGHTEPNFRLEEKINLARLEQIDARSEQPVRKDGAA
jgi:hypothetical protein